MTQTDNLTKESILTIGQGVPRLRFAPSPTGFLHIGAFRTALIMNLEPLVSTLASVALLGEELRPLQAFGGALMLLALCAFQLRR